MSSFLAFACVLLLSFSLRAQDIHPSAIVAFPTIHPDSLKIYEEQLDDFYNKEKSLKPGVNKALISDGPYNTLSTGCDWYGINGLHKAVASSELDSNKAGNYDAENAYDFDISTAWAEGQDGHGLGEILEFYLKMQTKHLTVNSLTIYNGYCASLSSWKANSRVKSFDVFANDEFIGVFHLKDTFLGQVFKFNELKGDENGKLILSFSIKEVYPGDKYEDTCISEINFDGEHSH